ncbi:class I tRNA ligase family protein [Blattabacterium cuenoti]|uniref:class I tRNA ligase family protein n=1 Tax=Blattabacterium cuenoti TaxID=1653831 RepID=UPI00163C2D16|nr:class I tRNA ligase family protein [Blattabacterium cuenoti]
MEYNFREIEKRWQKFWKNHNIFYTKKNIKYPKYYILNMFPYPSGSGLHIGHCLGYIASDIYARYKRIEGYNVLNPIGFDSFGLPAEQYAIQTGKHPSDTTKKNIEQYKKQINKLGLSFDWSRELCTSDPNYYRWTQWMFIQIFHSWYDKNSEKAKSINILIEEFNKNGNLLINASSSYPDKFNSITWKKFSPIKKESILLNYRLAYLSKEYINWCPYLGTVLANDEIQNEKSKRGGYPIYKKKMLQWHIRISAYVERLLKGLKLIECSKSLKDIQYNWIGKIKGASIFLELLYPLKKIKKIEFFIDRPEMIFGISFVILSIDHNFSKKITISSYKKNVQKYFYRETKKLQKKSTISGVFTGNYVLHPFIKKKIPIYISNNNFFSIDKTTNSFIGIPGHEKYSEKFAKIFNLEIISVSIPNNKNNLCEGHNEICINSYFLNGLNFKEAKNKVIQLLKKKNIGSQKNSYRLRDAVFSRQRYWGEPIPVFFKNKKPQTIPIEKLPIFLPKIDNYYPKNGKSPLYRIKNWAWDEKNMKIVSNKLINHKSIFPMETNTMPSWAGSSWYFLRYMDVNNNLFFLDKKKENYWKNIDLYLGGSEHSTGHLIYARFWHKFLKDRGWVTTEEPFKRILNQGMILSNSAIILKIIGKKIFVSYELKKNYKNFLFQEIYVDISLINHKNQLNINKFKQWRPEFSNAKFLVKEKIFFCKRKLEKMSKSKYNIITPDYIHKKYGSDIFRLHEMFLGPITKTKHWDEEKINGIKKFLNKFWRLFYDHGVLKVNDLTPTLEELKILHYTIKKLKEKIQFFSFHTSISDLMILVNKLTILKCNKKKILKKLIKLMAPFAPHISEELWNKLGEKKSIIFSNIPNFNKKYLIKKTITYPIMFNGKLKFQETFQSNLTIESIKKKILKKPKIQLYFKKKNIKKIIIIPNKIINILF